MSSHKALQYALTDKGMSSSRAGDISHEINGTDLITLVDDLDSIPDNDTDAVIDVLDEYGIIVSPREFKVNESRKPRRKKTLREGIIGGMVEVKPINTHMKEDSDFSRMMRLSGIRLAEDEVIDFNDEAPAEPEDDIQTEPETFGSDAVSAIQDALETITANLPELKISEYRDVVSQIKELLDSARDSGRDYIGESRFRRVRR